MSFNSDFVWGAAAAAYQVEGAAFEDGKGWSVWDMMCRKEGAIFQGQKGDVACDHYHLYKKDVSLMKEIGLKGYRMSLSWPRIMPDGVGRVNEKGLDFYDRLIDELLENGIKPFVTLFHWDYPYELFVRGGWLNPQSSDWFRDYTKIVVERLSDRVTDWMTLNEPQCFIGAGHLGGHHAPGIKLGIREVLLAGHNALLAHGKAVQTIRQYAHKKANIGYAPVGVVKIPDDPSSQNDIEAARKSMFTVDNKNCWNNTWWMDPVFFGSYPEDGLKLYGDCVPSYSDSDMAIISEPVDFTGANIYNGRETYADENGEPKEAHRKDGYPYSALKWAVAPESLYWGPKFFYERYGKPIVITENGLANIDWIAKDGAVHDPQRIDFMACYLASLKRAAKDGVDIKGYFHWSFTDNFEWAEGFSVRMGLVYVDYVTQQRTVKDSGFWYKTVIDNNGEDL
ncbi:MAG: GH1 family beta-glucosidase [Sedimentisphaeraceae bacterium JB056]